MKSISIKAEAAIMGAGTVKTSSSLSIRSGREAPACGNCDRLFDTILSHGTSACWASNNPDFSYALENIFIVLRSVMPALEMEP
jgi:hypothetical protein